MPSLFEGLDSDGRAAAREACEVQVTILEPGPWHPPEDRVAHTDDLGFVVLRGLLTRTVGVEERDFSELLGEGDLIRPWDPWEYESSVRTATRWQVLQTSHLAMLDRRIALAVGQWPSVTSALLGLTMQRARTLAFHLAACHITRVELRLLVVLWHFADRWGRVGPDGIVLTLPLTHALLA